jgi:hypothetical protein
MRPQKNGYVAWFVALEEILPVKPQRQDVSGTGKADVADSNAAQAQLR